MTRLFLLRKYEVQMQALGDGGNRGHDIHTYVPPAMIPALRDADLVVLRWWTVSMWAYKKESWWVVVMEATAS